MGVIINELEHGPAPGERGARGGGSGTGAGGSNTSPTALQAQIVEALRREASRQARLWAD